jgi:hypothetical protein
VNSREPLVPLEPVETVRGGPARGVMPICVLLLIAACCLVPARRGQAPQAAPEQVLQATPSSEPYLGFLEDLEALATQCPLGAPAEIRLVDLGTLGAWGRTEWLQDRGCWSLLLAESDEPVLRDTLIHEWAHALVSKAGGPLEDSHGPFWGVAYARCYRAVVGD